MNNQQTTLWDRLMVGSPVWLPDAIKTHGLNAGQVAALRAVIAHADAEGRATCSHSQIRDESLRIAGFPRFWGNHSSPLLAIRRLVDAGLIEIHREPGRANTYRVPRSEHEYLDTINDWIDRETLAAEMDALAAVHRLARIVGHEQASAALNACLSATWLTGHRGVDRRRER